MVEVADPRATGYLDASRRFIDREELSMRLWVKSAAKARAAFHPGTTRQQAWDSLTRMFRDPRGSSLVGGSYSLLPVQQQGGPGVVRAGDIFKYTTQAATHYVRLTAFNPCESFAYSEFWSPATGPDYDHPQARDTTSTMEFRISDHPEFLVLDVRRTQRGSLPILAALHSRWLNPEGISFSALSSLLGPEAARTTAWADGWKNLPLDTDEAVVKRDRFDGPQLVESL